MRKEFIETLNKNLEAMSLKEGHAVYYAAHDDEYCYMSDDRRTNGSSASWVSADEIYDFHPDWIAWVDGGFKVCGDFYAINLDIKKLRRRVEDALRKTDDKSVMAAAMLLRVNF